MAQAVQGDGGKAPTASTTTATAARGRPGDRRRNGRGPVRRQGRPRLEEAIVTRRLLMMMLVDSVMLFVVAHERAIAIDRRESLRP